MSDWIDVSIPLRDGMVHWPGDPAFHIEKFADREKGDDATVSRMSLSVHTGTHMDAPLHFIPGSRSIDEMPIEATVGPARVVFVRKEPAIEPHDLQGLGISKGERVLFRTVNSVRCWNSDRFEEEYVFLSPDAARYLADREVRCVGIDYLSVDPFRANTAETHRILLGAGVWIIEGLNLKHIEPGDYEMVCLPLRLIGSEGAPARAILKPIHESRTDSPR